MGCAPAPGGLPGYQQPIYAQPQMPQPRMLAPVPRPVAQQPPRLPVARGQKADEPRKPLVMPTPEQLGVRAASPAKIEMPPPEQLGVAAKP